MNRRKISAMLAVALITSQVQGITFAETKVSSQEIDKVNKVILENLDDNSDDSATNSEDDLSEEGESTEGNGDNSEEEHIESEENIKNEENTEENIIQDNEVDKLPEDLQSIEEYTVAGKLELDINFDTPIKVANSEKTDIWIKITKDGKSNTVKLGSDITSGKLNDNIMYSLEALDYSRKKLDEGDTELNFYHLTFENLDLGKYSIEISGSGYGTTTIKDIEIQNSSKRILLGTDEKKIEAEDGSVEQYPCVLISGDFNSDSSVNKEDYEMLKDAIKSKSSDSKFDLNIDGKVDITDLSYVHQNINKTKNDPVIVNTNPIINPNNININVDIEKVKVNGDIKNILKNENSTVSLESTTEISEINPIEIPMDLSGKERSSSLIEEIVIQAPSENAPSSGEIVIPGVGENGKDLTVKFNDSNITKSISRTADGKEMDTIKIDLGKQVAVSQISIKVTGSRSNKNLTEIARVEFLNNVYKEMPKPKMNIPVINQFTSTTQVGQESMTIGWKPEINVSGYEIKVEELNNNNQVVNTSIYKTNDNSLKIEKVNAYGIYRFSIQSISGEWKSGYKDEQEGYSADTIGSTNLTNNSNDKDGKPDNVDSNYKPQAWDFKSGQLSESASGENGNNFGADSIVELQVIPETVPLIRSKLSVAPAGKLETPVGILSSKYSKWVRCIN